MNTEIVDYAPAPLPANEMSRIAKLSTDQLKDELSQSLAATAESLVRMAVIVRTLEERGEDLSSLRIGLIGYLRKIAYGQLVPDLVVRYAHSPLLVQSLARLPVGEQRKLASGQKVRVVRPSDGGEPAEIEIDPSEMDGDDIRTAFAMDGLRPIEEQRKLVMARQRRVPKPTVFGEAKADKIRGGIVVRRTFVPQADVCASLAELRGKPTTKNDDTSSLIVKISSDEHRHLRVRAAEGKVTLADLVRDALYIAGYLEGRTD